MAASGELSGVSMLSIGLFSEERWPVLLSFLAITYASFGWALTMEVRSNILRNVHMRTAAASLGMNTVGILFQAIVYISGNTLRGWMTTIVHAHHGIYAANCLVSLGAWYLAKQDSTFISRMVMILQYGLWILVQVDREWTDQGSYILLFANILNVACRSLTCEFKLLGMRDCLETIHAFVASCCFYKFLAARWSSTDAFAVSAVIMIVLCVMIVLTHVLQWVIYTLTHLQHEQQREQQEWEAEQELQRQEQGMMEMQHQQQLQLASARLASARSATLEATLRDLKVPLLLLRSAIMSHVDQEENREEENGEGYGKLSLLGSMQRLENVLNLVSKEEDHADYAFQHGVGNVEELGNDAPLEANESRLFTTAAHHNDPRATFNLGLGSGQGPWGLGAAVLAGTFLARQHLRETGYNENTLELVQSYLGGPPPSTVEVCSPRSEPPKRLTWERPVDYDPASHEIIFGTEIVSTPRRPPSTPVSEISSDSTLYRMMMDMTSMS